MQRCFLCRRCTSPIISGQGFDWPWLSFAAPLDSFAWNVPVGLSGAVACLFTREIADLKHFSPRVYAHLRLACAWPSSSSPRPISPSSSGLLGAGQRCRQYHVRRRGRVHRDRLLSGVAARQSRGGLVPDRLGLLEGFTIAAALRFLVTSSRTPTRCIITGCPLSMVAASILIALGVADRLRAQRVALSEAERRAQTDPLTGVLNRRSLIERLDAACARAKARGLPIALLFIDLDHFKQINDTFGHQAGDACLRAIIDPIHAELRQSDVIGRYGGEEFVVILSSADAAAATPIAQRILERVADVRVDGFGAPISVTCSIGIAASDTLGIWGEPLLAQADAAVYVAKRSGRNQIHLAPAGARLGRTVRQEKHDLSDVAHWRRLSSPAIAPKLAVRHIHSIRPSVARGSYWCNAARSVTQDSCANPHDRIESALRSDDAKEHVVAQRILATPGAWNAWELEHSGLMRQVADFVVLRNQAVALQACRAAADSRQGAV